MSNKGQQRVKSQLRRDNPVRNHRKQLEELEGRVGYSRRSMSELLRRGARLYPVGRVRRPGGSPNSNIGRHTESMALAVVQRDRFGHCRLVGA